MGSEPQSGEVVGPTGVDAAVGAFAAEVFGGGVVPFFENDERFQLALAGGLRIAGVSVKSPSWSLT